MAKYFKEVKKLPDLTDRIDDINHGNFPALELAELVYPNGSSTLSYIAGRLEFDGRDYFVGNPSRNPAGNLARNELYLVSDVVSYSKLKKI